MSSPQTSSAENKALQYILKALLSPQLYSKYIASQDLQPSTISPFLTQFNADHESELSDITKAQLQLLGNLRGGLDLPASLCSQALVDGEDACISFDDVITKYWVKWDAEPSTKQYATMLFEKRPAAVVSCLVANGSFGHPVQKSARDDVLSILRGLDANLNLLKQPLSASNATFASLPNARRQELLPFFRSLQQLSTIITQPLDLSVLLALGFSSVETVAYSPFATFKAFVAPHGIDEEHAKKIHDQARRVQKQTEQIVASLVMDNAANTLAKHEPAMFFASEAVATVAAADNGTSGPSPGKTNMSDWFGDLDDMGCPDCCSVTSPAAYFVDLLRFLKTTSASSKITPDDESALMTSAKPPPNSLLKKLFERRPELGDLLLSCRNTSERILYIDLVNEILESAVVYLDKKTSIGDGLVIDCHNADDEQEFDHDIYPGSTLWSKNQPPQDASNVKHTVYDQVISRAVYPSSVFPYDHSKHALREYLEASGTTLADVIGGFQPWSKPDAAREEQRQETVARSCAAAVLGLAEGDFVALTEEPVYPIEAARLILNKPNLSKSEYQEHAGLKPSWHYWGYPDDDAEAGDGADRMLQSEQEAEDSEGGAHLGLTFIKEQLLPRLGESYATLVQLLETRFLANTLVIVPFAGSSLAVPPSQIRFEGELGDFRLCAAGGERLNTFALQRLEQILRLWRRCKNDNPGEQQMGASKIIQWSLSDVDDALCAFGQVNLDAADSEAEGEKHKSITPQTLKEMAAIAQIAQRTEMNVAQIIALFDKSASYLRNLPISRAVAAGPRPDSEPLTLSSRYLSLLLASLDLAYADYTQIQADEHIAADSKIDIDIIYLFSRLSTLAKLFAVAYSDLPELLVILRGGASGGMTSDLSTPEGVLVALKMWQGFIDDGWTAKSILSCLSKDAVEDSKAVSAIVTFISKALPSLAAAGAGQEDAGGSSATAGMFALSSASLVAAVQSLVPEISPELAQVLLSQQAGGSPFSREDDGAVGDTETVQQIVSEVLEYAYSNRDAEESEMNGDYLAFTQPCTMVMKCKVPKETILPLSLRFGPDYTCTLAASASQDDNSPVIRVEGKMAITNTQGSNGLTTFRVAWPSEYSDMQITFETAAGSAAPTQPAFIIPKDLMEILEKELSKLKLHGSLLQQYRIGHQEVQALAPFLLGPSKDDSLDSLRGIERYSFIRNVLVRTGMEAQFSSLIAWFCGTASPLGTIKATASRFLQTTLLGQGLAERLLVANLRAGSSDDMVGAATKGSAERFSLLATVAKQMRILQTVCLKHDSVSHLFAVAQPTSLLKLATNPATASSHLVLTNQLRASLVARGANQALSTTQDRLRNGRRGALVQYIIQNPAMKASGKISDEGSLFEFFLIDVQMSSKLETTRIQQAISTIQLFVHRALLGSESDIEAQLISRERWSWMQRYTTWEANRRVFLYPESYADPTLRDGKTEVFQSVVEEGAMQNTLDDAAVQKIIRGYVYAADEVANLRVDAVFYNPERSGTPPTESTQGEGVYHLFARTRNAPYTYFYRSMEHTKRGQSIPSPVWTPWTKMPFEITGHEVDADGNTLARSGAYIVPVVWRKRLMVFMPKLTVKTNTDKKNGSKGTLASLDSSNQVQVTNPAKLSIDIKLAWTEQVDSVFTTPKQGQPTLNVAADGSGKLLPFESFWFEAVPSEKSVSVLVYQNQVLSSTDATTTHTCIGEFVLYGDNVTCNGSDKLSNESSMTKSTFLNTEFGSLTRSNKIPSASGKLNIRPDDSKVDPEDWPTLPLPEVGPSEVCTSLTWTLNSQSGRRRALVVDATLASSRASQPWFLLSSSSTSMPLYNPLAEALRDSLAASPGLDALYRVMDLSVVRAPDAATANPAVVEQGMAFGNSPLLAQCREDATPSAIYNWEAGFHNISLLVERLIGLQQFEKAIELARLVFDPTGSSLAMTKTDHNDWRPVWRFPPFRDPDTRSHGTAGSVLSKLLASSGSEKNMDPRILAWRRSPFRPHAVARNRPLAYMKRFVMKYIEALVAAGDNLFRQDSLELVPLAVQKYIEALHVFGPQLQTVTGLNQKKTFRSYNQLAKRIDDFSNASVLMQLTPPYHVPMKDRAAGRPAGAGAGADDLDADAGPQTTYFGVQANKDFVQLRASVEDRLFKIRNSLDINGNPRTLRIWDPPINPNDLVKAVAAAGGNILAVLGDGTSGGGSGSAGGVPDGKVLPRKRFGYLLSKALELCAELKASSGSLLVALEKKDGEALAMLRAKQDSGLLRIVGEMKEQQKKEAELGLEQLEQARLSHVHRLEHYAALTGDSATVKAPSSKDEFNAVEQAIPGIVDQNLRLNTNERLELDYADRASKYNAAAAENDWWAGIISLVPMPALNIQPGGLGVTEQLPSFAQAFQIQASIERAKALGASEDSVRSGRMAQWMRQLQERRLQLNLAGFDIKAVDKQIEVQKARIAALDADLRAHQHSTDASAQTLDFLSSKLTNQQLYGWLETATRATLYRTYLVAMELARKVETAYLFERRAPSTSGTLSSSSSNTSFISATGYWDNSHHGLHAGEQLWLALKQLELAYMAKDEGRPVLYITKNISLRQLNPSALVSLREKGEAEFDLPELLFDLDFPGHYFRRIHSVSFSVPCVAGPYTSVNCTATLVDHRYRTSSAGSSGSDYAEKTSSGGDRSDDRFSGDAVKLPITSVAISTGQNDTGVFDLAFNMNDDYQPFEGAGAISSWRLKLPAALRQFDYGSISDVVMHLRYSALDGGETLRNAAKKSAEAAVKKASTSSSPFSVMIDVKQEAPDAAYALLRNRGDSRVVLPMRSIDERLPYFARSAKGIKITDIVVLTTSPTRPEDARKWKIKLSPHTKQPTPADDPNAVRLGYSEAFGDMVKFTRGAGSAGHDEPGAPIPVMSGNMDSVKTGPWDLEVEGLSSAGSPSNLILLVDYVLL